MKKITLFISFLIWCYAASAQEKYNPEIHKSRSEYLKEGLQLRNERLSSAKDTLLIIVYDKKYKEIKILTNYSTNKSDDLPEPEIKKKREEK